MSPGSQRPNRHRRVRETYDRDIDKSVEAMARLFPVTAPSSVRSRGTMSPKPAPLPSGFTPPSFPLPPLQTLESYIRDNTVESMSRLFPVPTTRRDLMRKTYVLWDMSDYPIPEYFNPISIGKQIQSAIKKECYRGELQIWLYGAENTWSTELIDQLEELRFKVFRFKGVKLARLNLIIAYFLTFVLIMDAPTNLLMLSSNKEEMEQEPIFSRVRQILEDRGFCVVSAQPESLINPDTHSACDPDQIGLDILAHFRRGFGSASVF